MLGLDTMDVAHYIWLELVVQGFVWCCEHVPRAGMCSLCEGPSLSKPSVCSREGRGWKGIGAGLSEEGLMWESHRQDIFVLQLCPDLS